MKIAITGDFHFGFNEDALEQARRVLIDAKQKSDAIIAAGDLYDYRVPSQEVVLDSVQVFTESAEFGDANVEYSDGGSMQRAASKIVAIYGTHERRTKGLANIIDILHAAGCLVNCHSRKVFVTKADGKGGQERVCIQGMGGVPEEFAGKVLKLMDYSPEEGCTNIFVFHQSLSEIIPQDKECISMADLPHGFDLYVDGHIHWRHDVVEAGRHLLIPGSTVVTQMKKNEAQSKGYYLYDTATRKANFIEVPTRPFHFQEIEFKDAGMAEVEKRSREALGEVMKKHAGAKPLVKLKLTGTLAPGLSSSHLDLSGIEADHREVMMLSIDKGVGGHDLREKLDVLRRQHGEKRGAADIGKAILREKLAAKNIPASQLPEGAAEPLFDALAEGDSDKAIELLGE